MISLFLRCDSRDEEELSAELWERGTAGIADEPCGLRAFFEDDERASELMSWFTRFYPQLRIEEATDWERVSRDAFPPILVGDSFFLVSPWCDDPTPPGRLRLEIEPGMACGTGRHPATQLCLEGLERYLRPGATVLDVGCGSGILSAAALLLGASRVIACDIDADAISIARQRVNVPFLVGSIDAIARGAADLIVANINSTVVEQLGPEFERVQPSVLILSGFPEWDSAEGFEPVETLRRGEWVCLVCLRGGVW